MSVRIQYTRGCCEHFVQMLIRFYVNTAVCVNVPRSFAAILIDPVTMC